MRFPYRSKRFIDRSVQGQLLVRVVTYWALCMVGMFVLLAGVPIVVSWFFPAPGSPTAAQLILQTWRVFWPPLFAAALILPLLLADVVRVSHRFVGPVYRLRSALRDLADGKPTPPLGFREGDFWGEMAGEFNRVAARLQEPPSPVATPDSNDAANATPPATTETLAC